jgi:hypothetical protein
MTFGSVGTPSFRELLQRDTRLLYAQQGQSTQQNFWGMFQKAVAPFKQQLAQQQQQIAALTQQIQKGGGGDHKKLEAEFAQALQVQGQKQEQETAEALKALQDNTQKELAQFAKAISKTPDSKRPTDSSS